MKTFIMWICAIIITAVTAISIQNDIKDNEYAVAIFVAGMWFFCIIFYAAEIFHDKFKGE